MAESERKLTALSATIQLNKKEKRIISSKIAQGYRKLARRLSFEESEIKTIQYECDSNGQKDPEEYCMEIITRWEQREGTRASKEWMKQALTNIPRQDIVDQLCNKQDVMDGSNEQVSLSELKETQTKLECAQLEAYKGIEMEIAPWMTDTYLPLGELYVELQMFSADKFGNEDNGVLIDIDEIFNTIDGDKQPRRILVEGDAGFGKTTLLNKLVDDWTKKNDYIYHKFRNVFLFYLREFNKDQSFEDLIRIDCKELDVNEEEGLKCTRTFEKETLFLLDGYDELSEDSKTKFENLLQKKEFKQATIIVTSRRNEFQRQNENKIGTGLSVKHGSRKDHIYIWDKRILISGISEENRIKFLQKYFQIENGKESLEQHFHIANKELFRCPLFLILFATVKDEENVQMIKTQTDFYKFLLNVVTRRSLIRIHELDENINIELFDSKHENYHEKCAKQMDLFGSLAIKHLINNDLTFTHEEIEKCFGRDAKFTKLGFINRRMTYKNNKRKCYFEPFHKSFLELFAAFTLYRLAAKSEESDQEEFKKKISDLVLGNVIPNGTSLIYPFLAGLLHTESFVLFEALSPWGCLWDIFEGSFLDIIIETKTQETLISSFIPFISPILHINEFFISNSKNHKNLWDLFHHLFASSYIFQRVRLEEIFLFQIRAKNIELLFHDINDVCLLNFMTQDNLPKFKCENLFFQFEFCTTNMWEDAIKIFHQTKFKTLKIEIFGSIDLIPLFYKELTEGLWTNLCIDELAIYENETFKLNTPETYFCLFNLVKNKKIKNIMFRAKLILKTQTIEKETFDFLDWECLNQISIDSTIENPVIPFSRLCQSLKKWKFINFGNQFDYSLSESNLYCSVEKIKFIPGLDKKACEFVMKHCTGITTLSCDAQLLDTCFSTHSLSTLQDLTLKVFIDDHLDWSKLLVLPQLHLLKIHELDYMGNYSSFAKKLTSFVCQSKLETLYLKMRIETLLIILQNFYKIIEKLEVKKNETLSSDSEKYIGKNLFSNLKSLGICSSVIDIIATIKHHEIIALVKLLLKRNFVEEIIWEKYIQYNVFLLVSFPTEGFLLSWDKKDNEPRYDKTIIFSYPDPMPN